MISSIDNITPGKIFSNYKALMMKFEDKKIVDCKLKYQFHTKEYSILMYIKENINSLVLENYPFNIISLRIL